MVAPFSCSLVVSHLASYSSTKALVLISTSEVQCPRSRVSWIDEKMRMKIELTQMVAPLS